MGGIVSADRVRAQLSGRRPRRLPGVPCGQIRDVHTVANGPVDEAGDGVAVRAILRVDAVVGADGTTISFDAPSDWASSLGDIAVAIVPAPGAVTLPLVLTVTTFTTAIGFGSGEDAGGSPVSTTSLVGSGSSRDSMRSFSATIARPNSVPASETCSAMCDTRSTICSSRAADRASDCWVSSRVPSLAREWTYDGGHLNDRGRTMAAAAFLEFLQTLQDSSKR